MKEPVVAQKAPYAVELKPGTYYWCACGKSSNQPCCDGKHKDTEFTPTKVEVTEEKTYYLCGCKHSENGAFCDGKHKSL